MPLGIVNRLVSGPRLRPVAALAVMLWTGFGAPASAAELPCGRFAKTLATGTIAERKELHAAWQSADPAAIVKVCGIELRRAFLDPLRKNLPPPSMPVRRMENQWLAAYLTTLSPEEGPLWIRYLDVDALERPDLERLTRHFAAGPTTATQAIFRLSARVKDPAFKNEALHIAEPQLLKLEAHDVTTATQLGATLRELGYGFVYDDATASAVWSLHLDGAPEAATTAELKLAAGDPVAAFRAYAQAAQVDKRYLVHAALLADLLMADGRLAPTELIPLGIQYRRCPEGYGVIWGFGSLRHAAKLDDAELRAEAVRNTGVDCNTPLDDDQEADREVLARQYDELRARFGATRSGARLRLAFLEKVADRADDLSHHGRLVLGNQLREFAYPLIWRPDSFAYLGGATRARKLRDRVASYLAFPPAPEVHVNDPLR